MKNKKKLWGRCLAILLAMMTMFLLSSCNETQEPANAEKYRDQLPGRYLNYKIVGVEYVDSPQFLYICSNTTELEQWFQEMESRLLDTSACTSMKDFNFQNHYLLIVQAVVSSYEKHEDLFKPDAITITDDGIITIFERGDVQISEQDPSQPIPPMVNIHSMTFFLSVKKTEVSLSDLQKQPYVTVKNKIEANDGSGFYPEFPKLKEA